MTQRFRLRWSDLGCPTEPGTCEYQGMSIHVGRILIEEAGGNPDTICTVKCVSPYFGPPKYVVGSIERRSWTPDTGKHEDTSNRFQPPWLRDD